MAARQWRAELLARTTLGEQEIGEYSGERKEVRPVTIATYQVLITRSKGRYRHLELFEAENWGLVVYDEVHLLPAPVFRMTADIQSRRRLGLTATLVREDGRADDVFSLIGPKRYDAPWRDIEAQGWIAPAACTEVRVTLTDEERMRYAVAEPEDRYRVGASAASKLAVVDAVLARHPGEPTLVIGQFLDQLDEVAERLGAPLITGKTPTREREQLYAAFRTGEVPTLVVSKVANFSIDLPEATVAVQISGTLRQPPGGGAAARPGAAAEGRRPPGPLLRRSSRGTPTTRSSPPSGSGSWPSRATPTRSSTPPSSEPIPGLRPRTPSPSGSWRSAGGRGWCGLCRDGAGGSGAPPADRP